MTALKVVFALAYCVAVSWAEKSMVENNQDSILTEENPKSESLATSNSFNLISSPYTYGSESEYSASSSGQQAPYYANSFSYDKYLIPPFIPQYNSFYPPAAYTNGFYSPGYYPIHPNIGYNYFYYRTPIVTPSFPSRQPLTAAYHIRPSPFYYTTTTYPSHDIDAEHANYNNLPVFNARLHHGAGGVFN